LKGSKRQEIRTIGRHGNLSAKRIDQLLIQHTYPNKSSWHKFLRILFITLGVGFLTAGIVFFFAYNWDDLNKFVKLGLTEGLVIAATVAVLLSKLSPLVRNISLTGATVLVGVMFAVFGQIYQTGANAYDFFLAWTIFAVIWTLVSNFAPMYLLLIILANISLVLYNVQVSKDWSTLSLFTTLILVNSLVLIVFLWIQQLRKANFTPVWLTNLLALFIAGMSVEAVIFVLFDQGKDHMSFLMLLITLINAAGLFYGYRFKNLFYIALIPFVTLIMIASFMIRESHESLMLFSVGLLVIISVSLLINMLIKLQKKWSHE
jgi:uncharacterized membrane protein